MEFSLCSSKAYKIPSFLPTQTSKQSLMTLWVPLKKMGEGKIRCGKSTASLVGELERELKEVEKQGKEWREMENCRERSSNNNNNNKGCDQMVELLECMEREAIMGDDEGRDPNDYNRRAQIFDKSSKVFQALKELESSLI